MWIRWPYQRIGERAYMRSTYDRRGGNETADASHFLYQLAPDRNVTLECARRPESLLCALPITGTEALGIMKWTVGIT